MPGCANKELHNKFNEKIGGWFHTQEYYKNIFSQESKNSLNQLINFAEQENMTPDEKSAFKEWFERVKIQSFRETFETCFNDYNELLAEKEKKNMTCEYGEKINGILKKYEQSLNSFLTTLQRYEGHNSYEEIFDIDNYNMFNDLTQSTRNALWSKELKDKFCDLFNLSKLFQSNFANEIKKVARLWREFIKEINSEDFFFNLDKKLETLFKEKFSTVLGEESPLKYWLNSVRLNLQGYDRTLSPNLKDYIVLMVQSGNQNIVMERINRYFKDNSTSIFNLSSIAEKDCKSHYGYALNLGLTKDKLTIDPQNIMKRCEDLFKQEVDKFQSDNGGNLDQLLEITNKKMKEVFKEWAEEVKKLNDVFEKPEQLRNLFKEKSAKLKSGFPFIKEKINDFKGEWLKGIIKFNTGIKNFRDENNIDKLIEQKNFATQNWGLAFSYVEMKDYTYVSDTFSDDWVREQFKYYRQSHPEKFEEPPKEEPEPSENPSPAEKPEEEPKPEIQSDEQSEEPKPEENSENSNIEQQQSNSGTTSTSQQPKESENPSKPNLQPEPSGTKPLETDHTQQPKDEIEPTNKPEEPNSFHQPVDEVEAVPTESTAHQQNIEHEEQPEPQQQQEGNVKEIELFNEFKNLFNDGGVCFIRPNINGLKKGRGPSEASVALAFMHVFNPIFSDSNKQKKTRKALEDIKNKFIDHDKKFRPKYVALIKKIEEAKNKGDLNDDRKREKIQKEAKKLFENAQKNLDKITKKLHSTLSLEGQYTQLANVDTDNLYPKLGIKGDFATPNECGASINSNFITHINDSEFKGCIDRFFKIFGIRGDTAKDAKERYYRIGVISYKPINNYNRNRRLDYVFTEIFDKCFDEKSSDSQTRRWCQRFQKELGKYSSNYFTKFINLEKTIAGDVTVLNNTSSGNGKKIVDLFKKARKDLLKIFEGMYQNSKNLLYYRSLVRKNKDYFKTKMDIFKKLKKETDGDPEKLINELKKEKTAVYKYGGK